MATLRIGDESLTPAALAAAAREDAVSVELTPAARERMAAGRAAVDAVVAAGEPVYARTTGVGANYDVAIQEKGRDHSLRLLRSHAAGVGEPLDAEVTRATILVRLNQMAAGGGGHRPEVADALAALLRSGEFPELRDLGGLGTGDISVLAQLALALEDADGGFAIGEGDAAPFIGSNAATLAVATLAWADLRELLDAGLAVAAETFRALDGNREAFAPSVGAAPGVLGTAVLSRGVEEHASFAWQAAPQTRRAVAHVRTAIALEHLAAERALAMKAGEPAPEDRPFGEDAARAAAALPALAARVRDSRER